MAVLIVTSDDSGDLCRGDTWPGIFFTVIPGLEMLSVCVPESSSSLLPLDCLCWLSHIHTCARSHTQPKTITDLPVPHYTISAYDQSGRVAAASLMSLWYAPIPLQLLTALFWGGCCGPLEQGFLNTHMYIQYMQTLLSCQVISSSPLTHQLNGILSQITLCCTQTQATMEMVGCC